MLYYPQRYFCLTDSFKSKDWICLLYTVLYLMSKTYVYVQMLQLGESLSQSISCSEARLPSGYSFPTFSETRTLFHLNSSSTSLPSSDGFVQAEVLKSCFGLYCKAFDCIASFESLFCFALCFFLGVGLLGKRSAEYCSDGFQRQSATEHQL